MPHPHTPLKLSSAPELDHARIKDLLNPLAQHGAAGGALIVLDLSQLTFITPFGVVALATMLHHEAYDFESVQVLCPKNLSCLSYLSVSGFFEHLPDFVQVDGDHGLSKQNGRWQARTVLPLTRLQGTEDVGVVAKRVRTRLGQMIESGSARSHQEIKGPIASTAKELCQNIFDHARVGTGWVAAQKYAKARTPYVELAIGDAGCGIRASLSERHPDLRNASDAAAIEAVILEGLSRRAESGGTGYETLRRAAAQLDGRFLLRSGRGAVRQPRNRSRLVVSTKRSLWPGTQLMVRFSCA